MCDRLREYLKDHLKKKINIEIIRDEKGNTNIYFRIIFHFLLKLNVILIFTHERNFVIPIFFIIKAFHVIIHVL